MNNTNTGGQRFRLSTTTKPADTSPDSLEQVTLRDFFAAKAMQGIMANQDDDWGDHFDIAEIAYSMADAMLEAREA